MAPPTAVESSINFEGHPTIKSTQDPLVQKLSLNTDTVIRHNAPPPTLYEDGLLEKGTTISSTGALMAYSGNKTGRSPKDKRIVDESTSSHNIWWGPVNKQVDELTWKISRSRALDYLRTREKLFVVDAYAGWDPRYRIKVRIICARAYHALFMTNMLIRPTEEELKTLVNQISPSTMLVNSQPTSTLKV